MSNGFTTKENKIKQIRLVARELESSLIDAVDAGVDRDEDSGVELDTLYMYRKALDVIEAKVMALALDSAATKIKRDTKLDN